MTLRIIDQFLFSSSDVNYSSQLLLKGREAALDLETSGLVYWHVWDLIRWGEASIVHVKL